MVVAFDYDKLKTKNIIHYQSDSPIDCIGFLVYSKADAVSCNHTRKILPSDVKNTNVDKYGNYSFVIDCDRDCDLIGNISFESANKNLKSLIIHTDNFDYYKIPEFLPLVANFLVYFKFIFSEKPSENNEITITYTRYYLDDIYRKELAQTKHKNVSKL